MPDVPELLNAAYAAYDRRDLEAALADFSAVLAANPSEQYETWARFGMGRVWTDRGDYRKARTTYARTADALSRAIVSAASAFDLPRLYNDRAVAKALSGELESSLQDFDDAILLNGGSYAQASKSKGRVLLALRRFPEAYDAYRASIDELPGDGDAHYGLARVLAEEDNPGALTEARRAKDLTEARELADAAEAAEPQRRAGPYLFFAWALRAWGGDEGERRSALARAIAICERNIEGRRDRPMAKYLLANAQLELGEYSVAAASFADAIDLLQRAGAEPDRLYTALAGHGRALTLAERFGEALEACQQAVTLAPSAELRESSLVDRAYILRRLERIEEAVAVIEEARDSARAGGRLPRPGAKVRASGYRSWGILATETMIRIAVAEKYRDSSSWSDAVGAFEQAVKAVGGRVRPTGIAYPVMAPLPPRQRDGQVRRDERIAYGSLLTAGGYARWQLGDLQGAEAVFSQAKAVLPPDSEDRYSAESALRRVRVARSFRLPRWLPHLTTAAVVALVAAATALEAVHRLSGPAWATTVLGLAVLAVASWCLPVIRTLKIGGAEFTKEVGYREEAQVVRLSLAPLTVGAPPDDSLRQTTGYLPRLQLVQVGDEVAEGPAGDSSHPATEPAQALWTVPETVPASGDGAAGPAEMIAGELRQAAERDRTAPDEADNVYRALRRASVYALGEPAGDVAGDHGTESDLLHFAVDDKVSGGERVLLPVFTGLEPMQAALLRNPDWQTLSVLEVNGAAVADNIDPEVHIVVDPWTEGEHQLPSRAESGHEPASRPNPATGAAP